MSLVPSCSLQSCLLTAVVFVVVTVVFNVVVTAAIAADATSAGDVEAVVVFRLGRRPLFPRYLSEPRAW